MTNLDKTIADAATKAAASAVEWKERHHPVRIDGKTYWLSTSIPREIQDTLDTLPNERDKSTAKRTNQIKTRLSDEEQESFDLLVKTSGLSQSDYIRGMILHGKVDITQTSYVDKQTLDILTQLSAELGRLAGLIRQTVIVNKQFATLTDIDKRNLEQQIHALRRVQSTVQRTTEKLYGNLEAQKQP